VRDEADRMLDMGFIDEVDQILSYDPEGAQTLCFSATFPEEIRDLSRRMQDNPREIVVESQHKENVIAQHFYEIPGRGRGRAVIRLLEAHQPESVLVFCNTKNACRRVAGDLEEAGLSCLQLHGDLEQKERNETLIRFANGSCRILVATDVAARGLDIQDLEAVINYDLPFETENYVHRIGRTGRAGKTGQAFSLLKPGQRLRLDEINEYQKSHFVLEEIEDLSDSGEGAPGGFPEADMLTLSINGGRKNKISAGDLLGALTAQKGIDGSAIGKIDRMEYITFVAVRREIADKARKVLEQKPIKGRHFKVMRHD
jgi:ATP-independent RNA helicase DbpA